MGCMSKRSDIKTKAQLLTVRSDIPQLKSLATGNSQRIPKNQWELAKQEMICSIYSQLSRFQSRVSHLHSSQTQDGYPSNTDCHRPVPTWRRVQQLLVSSNQRQNINGRHHGPTGARCSIWHLKGLWYVCCVPAMPCDAQLRNLQVGRWFYLVQLGIQLRRNLQVSESFMVVLNMYNWIRGALWISLNHISPMCHDQNVLCG